MPPLYTSNDGTLEESAVRRDAHICNIDRISSSQFTQSLFLTRYYQHRPFILTDYRINSPHFHALTSIDTLLARYGHEIITTASANTYSHHKTRMPFAEYIKLVQAAPISLHNESESTVYFFGDHDDPGQFVEEEEMAEAEETAGAAADDTRDACPADVEASTHADYTDQQHSRTSSSRNIRAIWSKLLRQYHPPTYILPDESKSNVAMNRTSSGSRRIDDITLNAKVLSGDHDSEGGIRRVEILSSESGRALLHEAEQTSSPSSSRHRLPPRHDYARYSFGVAGHRSGVPFHFHGAAIGEVLHGAKRWFLYPPKQQSKEKVAVDPASFPASSSLPFPGFRPELTQLQWLTDIYPTLAESDRPLQCTLHPEELIYVPGNYYHATMNLGRVSVFLSTFVDEQRMESVMKQYGLDIERIRRERDEHRKGNLPSDRDL